MNRYAALLRGIMPSNTNMRNEKLRAVFGGLGFERVASVLTSGNIVFAGAETDIPVLEDRIQEALRRELGIPGDTLIRSRDELRALVDTDPFPGLTHGRGTYLTVTFVKHAEQGPPGAPPAGIESIVQVVGYDEAARAILAVVDNTAPTTPAFMGWLEKVYGKDITTRTWLTVDRILKKLETLPSGHI